MKLKSFHKTKKRNKLKNKKILLKLPSRNNRKQTKRNKQSQFYKKDKKLIN